MRAVINNHFEGCAIFQIATVIVLYQIIVVYGGRPVYRWSVSPEMFVWPHSINSVTVD